jgi:hypothetical protein
MHSPELSVSCEWVSATFEQCGGERFPVQPKCQLNK